MLTQAPDLCVTTTKKLLASFYLILLPQTKPKKDGSFLLVDKISLSFVLVAENEAWGVRVGLYMFFFYLGKTFFPNLP